MKNFFEKIHYYLIDIGLYKYIPDEKFIKKEYKKRFNKDIDIDNPKTFNEKLQWLKLNDRKLIYTTMADKYEAKKYVADIIGKEYIIPTIKVWDKFSEIKFDELPNQFVLKCTHDSGGLLICKDKNLLNMKKAKMRFNLIMKRNYYYRYREWPYKDIKHRIIAEKYMGDNLNDYKFFCFNGKPEIILVCSNRRTKSGLNEDFFDTNWKHLNLKRPQHANSTKNIERPLNLNKMLELAEILAKDTAFIRVDFYEIDKKIYFGELTFFPGGGFTPFEPKEWDKKLGDYILLPTEDNKCQGDKT